jgi:hypothetical protein
MELSDATEKAPAIPGIDPGTLRLVAQCLNHYATPGLELFTNRSVFRRSRKISKSDVAFTCPSVCPHGTSVFPVDGMSCNLILEYFSTVCLVNSNLKKYYVNNGCFTYRPIQYSYGNVSVNSS